VSSALTGFAFEFRHRNNPIMCRYRYLYFSLCRHQQLILYDFCDKAKRVKPALASEGKGKSKEAVCDKSERAEWQGPQQQNHAVSSSHSALQQQTYATSSRDIPSTASITEQPQKQSIQSSSSELQEARVWGGGDSMAGLRPFDNFRNLLTGGRPARISTVGPILFLLSLTGD